MSSLLGLQPPLEDRGVVVTQLFKKHLTVLWTAGQRSPSGTLSFMSKRAKGTGEPRELEDSIFHQVLGLHPL